MKIMTIFGTRPEAVKMAPVVFQLKKTPGIETIVCVTAQHRELLDQVLEVFGIEPDIDLNLMKANQTLSESTANILMALTTVVSEHKPDWILAQGDTTTVMCASLVSYYHRIHFGHVEAGLRTHNKWEPFPEEINRRIAGVTADLHFAPTEHSRQNLLSEGVEKWRIALTGNTVIDALNIIRQQPAPLEALDIIQSARAGSNKKVVLMTAHRRENFGEPMKNIFSAVGKLAKQFEDEITIVYTVHLNPNVHNLAHEMLGDVPNVHLLPPLPYLTLVHILKEAYLVLTDSGGIQEEATALNIPTLVLRDVTERPEGVEAGVLSLVGADQAKILGLASQIISSKDKHDQYSQGDNPFGDGRAAEKLVNALVDFVEKEKS
jgi:UDP-N-acetylglucosamine 2-epimerase (non-hydrolysing)